MLIFSLAVVQIMLNRFDSTSQSSYLMNENYNHDNNVRKSVSCDEIKNSFQDTPFLHGSEDIVTKNEVDNMDIATDSEGNKTKL